MFRNLCCISVFLVLILTPFHFSFAQNLDVVKMGIIDFPPLYEYKNKLEFSGLLTTMMKELAKEAKLPYVISGYPTSRLYRNLAIGDTHFFIGVRGNPVYEDKVVYSSFPCMKLEVRVYTLSNTPLPLKKEDLRGQKVIVIRDYGYGELGVFLREKSNNISFEPAATHIEALNMLKHGRAKYLVDYKMPTETALKSVSIAGIHWSILSKLDGYIIISKKAPNHEMLLGKLEKAFKQLELKVIAE